MREFLIILLLTICITNTVSISIAEEQENTTANDINLSTAIKIGTESSKNTSPAETIAEIKEQKFRVNPTVRIRPLNSEINKSEDGIVEVFLNNPNLNEVTLEFDIEVYVPSDIYIYAADGGMAGGAGTVNGHFTVPSGSSRTITLHIKGEKVGTYLIHFKGSYWLDDNKNEWHSINVSSSFDVIEPYAPTFKSSLKRPIIAGIFVGLVVLFIEMYWLDNKDKGTPINLNTGPTPRPEPDKFSRFKSILEHPIIAGIIAGLVLLFIQQTYFT